jgi:methoxymalonate biosynthesis acyl carrier protein
MSKEEIKDSLKEYFKNAGEPNLRDNDSLFEKGVLDSFGVVEFLTFLESCFQVQIQIEDITEVNFSTLESIAELVLKQTGEYG